jgi:hypothetical protein
MVELMFFITLLNRFKNSLTIYSAHGFLIATILGASIKIFYDMLPWTDNLHIKTIHYCYTLYVIALALGVTAYRIRRTETYANYQSLILQSEYTIILFLSLFITSFLSIETVSVLFAMHYLIQKVLFPPSNTANTVALQIGNVVLMTFFVLKHIYWNDIHTQTNFYYFLVGLTPFLLLIRPGFLQLPLRWANRYDFWVYGYGFFITTSFYLIGKKISNFLPGILLLIFSLFICSFQHAIAMCFKRITEKTDQVEKSLFVVVMIALILFVFTHITVHIQSHYYIVPYISFSTILASLAIHVCGICQKQAPTFTNGILVTSHQHKTITDKIFAILSTCAYELILILLIITISLEVAIYLQIFIWGLLSLILIFLYNKFQMPKRIKLYSWIGFFASCLHLAVVTSRWDSPLQTWYSDTHLTGLLGILILFLTGNILIYSSKKDKQSCPSTLTIFYGAIPIFIASILFFFWRFDLAYLTLLIILLNIILIAIGFYWKNIRVIQFGYAALGLCVIRLIGFDLKESDILFRAFIFIGSGIMMILSQIIYSKFKHRLSK